MGWLALLYVPLDDQLADVLTKRLPSAWFQELKQAGNENIPSPAWEGVLNIIGDFLGLYS